MDVPCRTHDAEWNPPSGFDPYAGRKHNVTMHDTERPDVVVAFPGGTGTSHMMGYAAQRGTPVIQVTLKGELRRR